MQIARTRRVICAHLGGIGLVALGTDPVVAPAGWGRVARGIGPAAPFALQVVPLVDLQEHPTLQVVADEAPQGRLGIPVACDGPPRPRSAELRSEPAERDGERPSAVAECAVRRRAGRLDEIACEQAP